ncbi:hypothetical protein [Streptomyces alboflavus]|uniref:hypothetical protein n=1 Tax=Streptomyces alboflavus TaxID=67267 RepID=UPI000F656F7C|nr:hypothetical protein [Streptomyces alboflavus]
MTSRLRGALRAAGPPVLLALLLPAGPGTPTAHAAPAALSALAAPATPDAPTAPTAPPAPPAPLTTPSPTASAPYYGTGSLAGSRAGEGRLRPGRAEPVAVPDPAVWRPLPPPPREVRRPERPRATTPVEPGSADAPRERAAEGPAFPGLRVLPLGGGMVLIGLGLGFLGLRLRRG